MQSGIIADGAIRSGKTVSMSLSYVMWAMSKYDGQNFIMAGKTISSFKRNVLQNLKLMLTSRGYHWIYHISGEFPEHAGSHQKRQDQLFLSSSAARTKVPKTWYRVLRQQAPFLMRLR